MKFKDKAKIAKLRLINIIEDAERGVVIPLIHVYEWVFGVKRDMVRIDKVTLLKKRKYKELPIVGYRLRHAFTYAERELMLVNGRKVSSFYKLKNGDIIQLTERPKGKFLNTVIAVVVAAVYFAVTRDPNGAFAIVATAAVSDIARILIGVPQAQEFDVDKTNQRADIKGAKNTVSKSVVPVLLGRTKITPFYMHHHPYNP